MTQQAVNDFNSNLNDNIEHAAKVLGRSVEKRGIFDAVYTGKKKVKTVPEIARATGMKPRRVLSAGKVLVDNGLLHQVKEDGRTAYQKRDQIHHYKSRILSHAGDPEKLKRLPTKTRPAVAGGVPTVIRIRVRPGLQVKQITIDDIGSFSRVKPVSVDTYISDDVSEAEFRDGVKRTLGELGVFKDWGGETNDLYTSQLRIGGKRRSVAFAFKGPGMTGKLTPGKMGKNGDQIQRLFQAPAEVFIVQYGGQIMQSLVELMKQLAYAKAATSTGPVYYGVIDGTDSHRMLIAYWPRFMVSSGRTISVNKARTRLGQPPR